MSSLLESLKSYVTPELISQAAGALGESNHATEKGLGAALPALLSGIAQKTESPSGASDILSMLNNNKEALGGGLLSNLGGLFGGGNNSSLLSLGTSLLGGIFGDKVGSIANVISSVSGLSGGSSSSLLSMAAPLVMGVLGKKVTGDGLGLSGLTSLFSSEKEGISKALPSGFGDVLGLGSIASGVTNAASNAKSAVSDATRTASGYVKNTVEEVEEKGGGMGWLWPLAILLLAGGLLWYFMKGCKGGDSITGAADSLAKAATAVVDSTASLATSAVDSAGSAVASAAGDAATTLGAFFKRKLADGTELNVPENGIESKLVEFIEDKSKAVDKTSWFSFDRLYFETGKSVLKAESQEQLENIAKIMKAYPDVNIKLGGYTDNVGSVASNQKLSQSRAENTLKKLTDMGVAAARIAAEGYGPEHPVATNDTPEGRAKNRRIDVLVTKK